MLPGLRFIKQIIIAVIFAVLIGAVIFLGIRVFSSPPVIPTIDPLASLKPIEVLDTYLFDVGERDYDFLAKIKNPNLRYGSEDVQYEINLTYDSIEGGEAVVVIPGSFYILPNQTKYIAVSPIKTQFDIRSAELKIVSIHWHELDTVGANGVDFVATPAAYAGNRVGGSVTNNSGFDVNTVDVIVVLLDDKKIPIATNRTEIRTFLAHTTRGFEVSWFSPVDTPSHIIVEASANLFLNDTFIRSYGGHEQFQEY